MLRRETPDALECVPPGMSREGDSEVVRIDSVDYGTRLVS